MQRKAVFQVKGAVLIIAGAGSGKTTVLCNRIANMMRFGNAYLDNEVRDITPEEEQFLEALKHGSRRFFRRNLLQDAADYAAI